MTDKEKLLAFLAEKGVTFIEVKEEFAALRSVWEEWQEQGLKEAPFNSYLGIVPAKRAIVGRPTTPWPHILHEAGHLLAQAVPLASKEEEITWFGWEWAVVQHLHLSVLEFLQQNRDYGILWNGPYGYRDEVGVLRNAEEANSFFQERLQEAQSLGLVALDGTPLTCPNKPAPDQ